MVLRGFIPVFLFSIFLPVSLTASEEKSPASRAPVILTNFSEYPEGWKARGGQKKADAVYSVVEEGGNTYLKALVGENSIRIFKKIEWNPKSHPVLQWKWRVTQWPRNEKTTEAKIYIYVSLDRDFFGIPMITKYAWSRVESGEGLTRGGSFRPSEKVIRSGETPVGEWVTETINALEDFREVTGRDPRGEAYGIGILVDSGIEADFGPVIALERTP